MLIVTPKDEPVVEAATSNSTAQCVLGEQKKMREPGVEPGAPRWQLGILPLNHSRFLYEPEGTSLSPTLYMKIYRRYALAFVTLLCLLIFFSNSSLTYPLIKGPVVTLSNIHSNQIISYSLMLTFVSALNTAVTALRPLGSLCVALS